MTRHFLRNCFETVLNLARLYRNFETTVFFTQQHRNPINIHDKSHFFFRIRATLVLIHIINSLHKRTNVQGYAAYNVYDMFHK